MKIDETKKIQTPHMIKKIKHAIKHVRQIPGSIVYVGQEHDLEKKNPDDGF